MAVISSDLKFYLSGGAANTSAAASLGGERSTSQIPTGTLNNVFDNVSSGEATSGDVEYRCIYAVNTNGADTLNATKIWIAANTPSPGTVIAIGLDPEGVGDGSASGVAGIIATEQDAPAGVTFDAAANEAASLAIGDLGPGEGIAVWIRRTVSAGAAAYTGDGATLTLKGTPA